MRNFYVGMLLMCLSVWTIDVQADPAMGVVSPTSSPSASAPLTNNANLLSLNSLVPTATPNMPLLQGDVLVAKYTDLDKVKNADFSSGNGFIVVQYVGSVNLNDMNSPLLITDYAQVKTISNLSFFGPFDPNKTGVLPEKTLRKAQFAFVWYNSNGYPLVRSMANYGVHELSYDLITNQVKLNLYDEQAHQANLNLSAAQLKSAEVILNDQTNNKYLMAEIVHFDPLTVPPVSPAAPAPVQSTATVKL